MATQKIVIGARTSLTISGFSTLTNGSFATSSAYDNTANQPIDLLVEVAATQGATTGQINVFAIGSLDNSNYQTGVVTADVSVMTLIGVLPMTTNSTLQRKMFEVAACFGGEMPPYIKIVCQNSAGSTLTTGTIYTSEVSATVA